MGGNYIVPEVAVNYTGGTLVNSENNINTGRAKGIGGNSSVMSNLAVSRDAY